MSWALKDQGEQAFPLKEINDTFEGFAEYIQNILVNCI
jgi:hypothetical protein